MAEESFVIHDIWHFAVTLPNQYLVHGLAYLVEIRKIGSCSSNSMPRERTFGVYRLWSVAGFSPYRHELGSCEIAWAVPGLFL